MESLIFGWGFLVFGGAFILERMKTKVLYILLAIAAASNLWVGFDSGRLDLPERVSFSLAIINIALWTGLALKAKWTPIAGAIIYLPIVASQFYFFCDQWRFGISGAAWVQSASLAVATAILVLFASHHFLFRRRHRQK